MAGNTIYPKWKETISKANANSALNSAEGATGVYVALIDTGVYTYNAAHQFYSDLSGVVGTDQEILTKTQLNGLFNGDDVSFANTTGNSVEAIVIYRKNTGASTTWPLIIYMDTGVGGLPTAALSNTTVNLTWDPAGIFQL